MARRNLALAGADMKIIPLGPRVVVIPDKQPDKIGSVFIPDSAKKEPSQGKVVALGPGLLLENGERVPPGVKLGETVLWSERGGGYNTFKIDGVVHFSMHQDEILGVVEP
jgi:chaperonin GroES